MFLGTSDDDTERWSPRDRELAKALLYYERSICSGCGHPAHETQDTDREGWYVVEPVPCVACAAREQYAKQQKLEPGDRLAVKLDPRYEKRG